MDDTAYMRRALELAAGGTGLVSPNPLVGAVVVREGEVVGEGWHRRPGTPHAEAAAIEEAGDRARGATLFVTLEPCAHQGRTPPCAPALVEAGIARVVAPIEDPNPLVHGAGFRLLQAGGVKVDVGLLAEEATAQNEPFLRHTQTGLPLVTLKMAASLDGKAAARDGSSKWITGPEARAEVHRMRASADAILVGAGTAKRDDPTLTCRDPSYRGDPKLRIVVDGRGIVPEDRRVFDGQASTLVATTDRAPEKRRAAWARAGAEVLLLDDEGAGLVPLDGLMEAVGKRDVQHVLVEGGPTLAWDLVQRDLADRLVFFYAPVLVGGQEAPSVLMGDGMPTIGDARPIDILAVERVGRDVKVVARVQRDR